jgi:type VI secretion system secreted protein Hcp
MRVEGIDLQAPLYKYISTRKKGVSIMSFDAFVQIDGIDGESTDSKHSGWIEALNFSAGASQAVSTTASSAGGATAERANIKPFLFTKQVDSSSPKFDKIIIALYRAAGDDKVKFMEYELSNCIICDVSTNGGPNNFPSESISINFGKIILTYVKQKREGGGAAGNISAGWDLQKNCKV